MVRLGGDTPETITLLIIGFNSSMVRLGVKPVFNFLNLLPFQFQYGAIGRVQGSMAAIAGTCFNSSMVRLGAFCFSLHSGQLSFQFQYGAIGRKLIRTGIFLCQLFQFQYGAIGRLFFLIPLSVVPRFNSSMVRLGVFINLGHNNFR